MEDHVARQLKSAFGSKTLYEILEVERTASNVDIRKAYKKKALAYHPDKGGDPELFKALSIVHSILSDGDKRKIYDETGGVEEDESSEDFDFWDTYFRNLFPKLTIEKINEFSSKYQGSSEEKQDIVIEYDKHRGDLRKIMDSVMLAEVGDEERICGVIDAAIAEGIIKSLPKYEKSRPADFSSSNKKKNANSKKRKAADENSENSLAEAILANSRQRGASAMAGAMRNIFAKYGGDDSMEDGEDAEGDEYEIDDAEFEALREKITSRKGSDDGGGAGKGNARGRKAAAKNSQPMKSSNSSSSDSRAASTGKRRK